METNSTPSDLPMSANRMQVRYGTMTRQVLAFYSRLSKLPLDDWSSVSHTMPRVRASPVDIFVAMTEPDDDSLEAAAAARARLRAVMDTMPGALARAKNRVRSISGVAEGLVADGTLARMQRVALIAVLALIARPHLSADDFDCLYRPFATLIPVDDLEPV